MRRASALVLGLATIIAIPSVSSAQVNNMAQMQAFTHSKFYNALVGKAVAGLPQSIFRRCPALVSNGSTVKIIKPVTFGADGFPTAGLWKQTFPVTGCGNDTILNFYFSATAEEKINTIIGISGTTHADLTLQKDAVLYANIGASLATKDCKTFVVRNTKFEGYQSSNSPARDPGTDQHSRPWRETWTMTGCGHTVDVPLDFVPDAKGTQIIQAARHG